MESVGILFLAAIALGALMLVWLVKADATASRQRDPMLQRIVDDKLSIALTGTIRHLHNDR